MLLLRPKERYPVVQAEARAYFSAAELERATDFRPASCGSSVRARSSSWASWCSPCRSRRGRARARRPTGAAAAVAITLATTAVALPLRAARAQRAADVGLVTQCWGGWAVDVAK